LRVIGSYEQMRSKKKKQDTESLPS